MVGKSGVFIQQVVDVGWTLLASIPAHHQHVVDNAVRAVAMRANALEVACEITRYFLNILLVFLAYVLSGVDDDFFELGLKVPRTPQRSS